MKKIIVKEKYNKYYFVQNLILYSLKFNNN